MTAPSIKEALVSTLASLAAAISILERTPSAKKAVASDTMFDISLNDYKKALESGRAALATLSPPAGERWEAIARQIDPVAFDNIGLLAKGRQRVAFEATDRLFASGLVQDEVGWRTMDSAPKDGTPFLAWEGSDRGPFKCWWRDEWPKPEAYWMDYNDSEPNPTYWKPFSAPIIHSARDGGAES